jgi:peptide/nickel transport system permease protein
MLTMPTAGEECDGVLRKIPVPMEGSKRSRGGFRGDRLLWAGAALVLLFVGAAILASWLAPHDPLRQFADGLTETGAPRPPGGAYPLGTDDYGRDLLSRLLFGARQSLFIGVTATLVAISIGTLLGLAAGYAGGALEAVIMRLTDVAMAFPVLLLAIALVAVLRPSLGSVLLVVGLVNWTPVARVVRGETLAAREALFVEAARALGASHARIVLRHILPQLAPTLLVLASLSVATTILLDAGLSYLGVGVPPPAPSWGAMLTGGQSYYRTAPWLAFWPGLAIVLAVGGFNLLAFGLQRRLERRAG